MKNIKIADTTLCSDAYSFKEKLEIARQLEKLKCDIIELPEIQNERTDMLLCRTILSFVKNSTLSLAAGSTAESIRLAGEALKGHDNTAIRIEFPVSAVGLEYRLHKKADKLTAWVREAVALAKTYTEHVELSLLDATRAERPLLMDALQAGVSEGIEAFSIGDDVSEMLPDDFVAFVDEIAKEMPVPAAVRITDRNYMAVSAALLSAKKSVSVVKTCVSGELLSLEQFASAVRNCGLNFGLSLNLSYTELHRVISQLKRFTENGSTEKASVVNAGASDDSIHLLVTDDKAAVILAAERLGYDLSEEDQQTVYEEFLRTAKKKPVGARELDAIIASSALQVPPAYRLESYIINSGNIISASAQIVLSKDGRKLTGVTLGDGPVDAAFKTISGIIGHVYELDDFQIQSVTEGQEALGSALVKLRNNGRVYSGSGISTDIIGASIRAYLNAVNKIVYEETEG